MQLDFNATVLGYTVWAVISLDELCTDRLHGGLQVAVLQEVLQQMLQTRASKKKKKGRRGKMSQVAVIVDFLVYGLCLHTQFSYVQFHLC